MLTINDEKVEFSDLLRESAKSGAYQVAAKAARLTAISECLREVREARSNAPQELYAHFDTLISSIEKRLKETNEPSRKV